MTMREPKNSTTMSKPTPTETAPPANNRQEFMDQYHLRATSGVGVLMIRTREPYRAKDALMEYALTNERKFRFWNLVNGWMEYDENLRDAKGNPAPGMKQKDAQP